MNLIEYAIIHLLHHPHTLGFEHEALLAFFTLHSGLTLPKKLINFDTFSVV